MSKQLNFTGKTRNLFYIDKAHKSKTRWTLKSISCHLEMNYFQCINFQVECVIDHQVCYSSILNNSLLLCAIPSIPGFLTSLYQEVKTKTSKCAITIKNQTIILWWNNYYCQLFEQEDMSLPSFNLGNYTPTVNGCRTDRSCGEKIKASSYFMNPTNGITTYTLYTESLMKTPL